MHSVQCFRKRANTQINIADRQIDDFRRFFSIPNLPEDFLRKQRLDVSTERTSVRQSEARFNGDDAIVDHPESRSIRSQQIVAIFAVFAVDT